MQTPEKSDAEIAQSWEDMVLPYVLEDLPPEQKRIFEEELEASAVCRMRVYETRQIVGKLQSLPREKLSHDLRADVIAGITSETKQTAIRRLNPVLKVAACAALLLGAGLVAHSFSRNTGGNTRMKTGNGFAWLAAAQESSGAWNGDNWGGSGRHSIELTSLALLTLATGENAGLCKGYGEQILRAADFLTGHQDRAGVISEGETCTGYGHAIATCALLEVYKLGPTTKLKHVLNEAIRHLQTSHASLGGWAYQTDPGELAHPAGSAWALLATKRAAALGWPDLKPETRVPAQPANTIDLYPWYLLSTEFAGSDRENASRMLAMLKEGPASDGFSPAGGRIYSTAITTLALCVKE